MKLCNVTTPQISFTPLDHCPSHMYKGKISAPVQILDVTGTLRFIDIWGLTYYLQRHHLSLGLSIMTI